MVFGNNSFQEIQRELNIVSAARLSGRYAVLGLANEYFFANGCARLETLIGDVSKAFSAIVHDILGIQTILIRIETMLSVPELEARELNDFIIADIDLLFLYFQSVLDFLSEGIAFLFDYKGRRVNFSNLLQFYSKKVIVPTSELERDFLRAIYDADWTNEPHSIRNKLVHNRARSNLFRHPDGELAFQIFEDDNPLIQRMPEGEQIFAPSPVNHVYLRKYFGVLIGRLIFLVRKFGDLCFLKLALKVGKNSKADVINIDLPNIFITDDWMSCIFANSGITDEELANSSDKLLIHGSNQIDHLKLIEFLSRLSIAASKPGLSANDMQNFCRRIESIIKMVTNKKRLYLSYLPEEKSIYSFRALNLRRQYKDNPREHLVRLRKLLNTLVHELSIDKIHGIGKLQFGLRFDDLLCLTSTLGNNFDNLAGILDDD